MSSTDRIFEPDEIASVRRLTERLASLKVTLVLFASLAIGIAFYLSVPARLPWLIATPLFLLALNLLASITINPAFRRQPGLLIFHLALLALVLLIAIGRLTDFTGQAEVTVGERFDSASVMRQASLWHDERLNEVHFSLDRFSVDYAPTGGMAQRGATLARIRWLDAQGAEHQGIVGDHRPLVLQGYRFYTTHNKGFAPVFIWQPSGGKPQQGSIHLPAWPAHEHRQALDWTLPGTGHRLWTQLQFDEVIIDPQKPSQFHTPQEHILVIREGGQRHELRPGQSLDFADGRLTYKALRTWMGFAVFYDWTLPWLFAAGLVAVLGLGWHYWRKFAERPWLQEENQ